MIGVSAWILLLATVRDRAALAMSFLLPPLLFAVFAAIFAGASGTDLKIKVGFADLAHTADSERLSRALQEDHAFRYITLSAATEAAMNDLVRRGMADVGLVIRGDLRRRPDEGPPPVLVVEAPLRPLAASIVVGQVQRTLSEKLPDVALGRVLADVEAVGAIGPDDRAILDQAFRKEAATRKSSGFSFAALIERTEAAGGGTRAGNVLSYAGAVVSIFLLFGAAHGALTLFDERRAGMAQRLALDHRTVAGMLIGKFVFLIAQGMLQVVLVFLTAWIFWGATFDSDRALPWLLSTFLAAAAAAALALFGCALCASRRQAETLTTFATLMVAAVGGAMVPRYLMPPWLQEASWATPNAWIIRAFDLAVQPGARWQDLAAPWTVEFGIAIVALGAATVLLARRPSY